MHSSRAYHHSPASVAHHDHTAHPSIYPQAPIVVREPSPIRTSKLSFTQSQLIVGGLSVAAFTAALYAGYRVYRHYRSNQSNDRYQNPAASPYHSAEQQLDRAPQDEYVHQTIEVPEQSISAARSIKAILFDLDGTLVESSQIWFDLLNSAAKHFGYPSIPYDAWKGTFGQSMEKNVELFMVGLDQQRFNVYCDEHYIDFIDHLHILDGSIDLLNQVKADYHDQIVITTNCPRNITEIILTSCKLKQFFKHVVCAGDEISRDIAETVLRVKPVESEYTSNGTFCLRPKPSTDIIDYSCHLLNIQSNETIFVGDSKFDMISARAANCLSVGIGIKTGDCYANNTRAAVKVFTKLQQGRANE